MLNKLDPHSVFIPAEQLQGINEDLAGKFFGIGIEFNIFEDTINVVNILKDGPGDKAGIKIGDKFIKVDDSLVAGQKITPDKIRKLLRGDRGSKVLLALLRGSENKTIGITRDAIPLKSVDASYMVDKITGYIRLNKFSSQTYREFMDALMELKKNGMLKLILDLRGNGGGVLDEATGIADEFLDGDKLITYTEGTHAPKKEYRCQREGQFEKGSIVVLCDEGSASASEVLMGALQDWDRATIIGRRSFGKGLVQEQFDLSDGSALRLTIARYYTPLGRSIQRSYLNGEKAYYDEITKRFHDGETQTADSVKFDKSKLYTTRGGKIVYGGGGITPDYFVGLDTTVPFAYTAKIYAKNTISTFTYRYFLQNQQRLISFKNTADFIHNYNFSEQDWNFFSAIAAKDSISVKDISLPEKNKLINNLKASIARQLWRTEGLYEVQNLTDDGMKKAIEVLSR
jgi:carboxyl-terminal processing protease